MRNRRALVFLFAMLTPQLLPGAPEGAGGRAAEHFWPQWRGPLMTGVAPRATPPLEWSETKNVRWKVAIPGRGSATPVVWGDRIFVLTAVPTGKPQAVPLQQFTILAFGRADGKLLWKRVLREEQPHEGTHPTGTWASASAATDGEVVLAFFGSRGLYALDMNGTRLWEKDLGDMTVKLGFGEGSSPALSQERVVVQWDHEGESFIVALERRTGKQLWRRKREEGTSWASPLVVEHAGTTQIVTSATNKVRSYDAKGGDVLWETPGMTMNAIPTPVHKDGLVFLTSGFRGNALLAVKLDAAKGDISASPAIAWRLDRDTPYVPSPLIYGDELYILKGNSGLLTCLDAKTGERLYGPERLEGVPNVYASPIGAAGRVYIAGREGATAVVARDRAFKVLATNRLEDGFDASPVAVDSELYLRGRKFLYRISE